jgi:hypothetical protein
MKRTLLAAAALIGLCGSAAAEEGRPLKLEAVDQVIEQNDRAVQSCGRARRDTMAIVMCLHIDADGKVASVESTTKPTSESQCLARVAKRMKFPATGVASHLDYPFMILPQIRH